MCGYDNTYTYTTAITITIGDKILSRSRMISRFMIIHKGDCIVYLPPEIKNSRVEISEAEQDRLMGIVKPLGLRRRYVCVCVLVCWCWCVIVTVGVITNTHTHITTTTTYTIKMYNGNDI